MSSSEKDSFDKIADYFRVLLSGYLVLFLTPAVGLVLSKFLSFGFTMGLLLLLVLVAIVVFRGPKGWGALLGLVSLALGGSVLTFNIETERMSKAVRLDNVTVSQAQATPEAEVFFFSTPQIQKEHFVQHDYMSSGKNRTKRTYILAPVTDKEWSDGDPVLAWVVCHSYDSLKKLRAEGRAASTLSPGKLNFVQLQVALNKAKEKHPSKSSASPLTLTWGDPYLVNQRRSESLEKWFGRVALLWLVAWTINWVIILFRRKRETAIS